MSEWRQPWMSDEWLKWWKSLDHSGCTRYTLDENAPAYEQCHSMHCDHCERSTGSQGHTNCPAQTPETVAAATKRLGLTDWVLNSVNREAEACEDL